MVDAEDLVLVEHPADGVVELHGRRQVPADRLLDDDPRLLGDQSVIAHAFGNMAEEARPHGEVEGADALRVLVEQRLQVLPAAIGRGVDRDIAEPLEEGLDVGPAAFAGVEVLFERLAREAAIVVIAHLRARCADDARRVGQLPRDLAMEEGRQELAFRQVAGAAKDDVVERIDGNDLTCHPVCLCLVVAYVLI